MGRKTELPTIPKIILSTPSHSLASWLVSVRDSPLSTVKGGAIGGKDLNAEEEEDVQTSQSDISTGNGHRPVRERRPNPRVLGPEWVA